MADAWSTTVSREPEYDDYTQSQVMALLAWDSSRCPNCGNYDAFEPFKSDTRHVVWTEHQGQRVEVSQMRCVYCAAVELIRRDWTTDHQKDKSTKGRALPADGRVFVAHPPREEDA